MIHFFRGKKLEKIVILKMGQPLDSIINKYGDFHEKLLGVLPKIFKGHETHSQSVLQLPKEAKVLAYNNNDLAQSFSYKNHIWGTQFHPEFVANMTKEYLEFDKEKIKNSGKNYKDIYSKIEENSYGEILLNRFIEIVNES